MIDRLQPGDLAWSATERCSRALLFADLDGMSSCYGISLPLGDWVIVVAVNDRRYLVLYRDRLWDCWVLDLKRCDA